MTPATRNGLIAFVVALIVIVGGFAYTQFMEPPGAPERAPLSIGGPFTLRDENGVVQHDTDFRGKLMLVYFGYTYCPDACPTTLAMMSQTLVKLGPAATEFAPIFITVDPERDTPSQMKQYMQSFDPHFTALTGSAAQIEQAAAEYHVYYRKVPETGGEYTLDHSSVIYLMGRDGRYIGYFDANIDPNDLAQGLRKYR
jgi:protein SCO1/2